jgi:capsular polysaccharide biosynthesis protein
MEAPGPTRRDDETERGSLADHDHTNEAGTPHRDRGRFLRTLGLLALLLLPVLCGLAGYAVSVATPPRYTAEAYVLITATGDAGDVTPGDISQAVARVATSESVIAAADSDDLILAAREDKLTSSASPDAPLVELSATATSASDAAALANDLARAVEVHMATNAGVDEVRAGTFASASAPAEPSSPSVLVSVVAGVALGFLLAFVGFVLRRR